SSEPNAIAINGSQIFLGVPYRSGAPAVYVFTRGTTSWSQTQRLLVPSSAVGSSQFGFSLSSSGSTLAVGAPRDSQAGAETGAVFIYKMSGTSWIGTDAGALPKKIMASANIARQLFGYSVALENSSLVVGAPVDTNYLTTNGSGQAFAYNIANLSAIT